MKKIHRLIRLAMQLREARKECDDIQNVYDDEIKDFRTKYSSEIRKLIQDKLPGYPSISLEDNTQRFGDMSEHSIYFSIYGFQDLKFDFNSGNWFRIEDIHKTNVLFNHSDVRKICEELTQNLEIDIKFIPSHFFAFKITELKNSDDVKKVFPEAKIMKDGTLPFKENRIEQYIIFENENIQHIWWSDKSTWHEIYSPFDKHDMMDLMWTMAGSTNHEEFIKFREWVATNLDHADEDYD